MAFAKTMPSQTQPTGAPETSTTLPVLSSSHAKMQNRNGQYQRAQIETASPAKLVVLLYDGAIRFCTLALEAMEQGNLAQQHKYLINVQGIIAELMGSLKREAGGEVAENLFRIYMHMLEQLVHANLYDRREPAEAVLKMLYELRETWVEVERITAGSVSGGEVGATNPETGATTAVTAVRPQEAPARIQRLGDRSA